MEKTEILIRLRKEKGLSQAEVAEELGVTRQAVSRWEGGRAWPSMENLVALSRVYGVSVERLYQNDAIQEAEPEAVPEEMLPATGDAREETVPEKGMLLLHKHKWMMIAAMMVCMWCGTFLWGRLTNARAAAAAYLFWETAILIVGLIIKLVWRNRNT